MNHVHYCVLILGNIGVFYLLQADPIAIAMSWLALALLHYFYWLCRVRRSLPCDAFQHCPSCDKLTPQHFIHCEKCNQCVAADETHMDILNACSLETHYRRYIYFLRTVLFLHMAITFIMLLYDFRIAIPWTVFHLFLLKSTFPSKIANIYVR